MWRLFFFTIICLKTAPQLLCPSFWSGHTTDYLPTPHAECSCPGRAQPREALHAPIRFCPDLSLEWLGTCFCGFCGLCGERITKRLKEGDAHGVQINNVERLAEMYYPEGCFVWSCGTDLLSSCGPKNMHEGRLETLNCPKVQVRDQVM